jgi:hypothetical protein
MLYFFKNAVATSRESLGLMPMKSTVAEYCALEAESAGISRLHGSHVENQKFTTIGLPAGRMVPFSPVALSTNSTNGNFLPVLLAFVPMVDGNVVTG